MLAEHKENRIFLYDSYIHKETIKEIPGRIWDPDSKTWTIPCTLDNLITLQLIGCKMTGDLMELAKEAHRQHRTQDAPKTPFEPMPIKARPYAHQIEGYNLACMALRIFAGGDTA